MTSSWKKEDEWYMEIETSLDEAEVLLRITGLAKKRFGDHVIVDCFRTGEWQGNAEIYRVITYMQ